MESFLRGHVHAFEDWKGLPRILLYDNLRSVVLERRGDAIHFHPRMVELCAHCHFAARPWQVRAGDQKGRVERVIRYIRESFFAVRPFTTLEDFNRRALVWRDQVAHRRFWPGDDSKTVEQALEEERPRLLPLPLHRFDTDLVVPIRSGKTMIAKNICHAAVLAGYSVLFRSAATLIEELQCDSPESRRRKLRVFANAGLVCIDEVGYLSFDDKAADLLYEVINRRYERRSVIVTTNRGFKEWNEVFPNASCIVTLVDRLTHHTDVTKLDGESYRHRESELESAARRRKK